MIGLNTYMQDESMLRDQHFSLRQTMIWTALPAIVRSFNPKEMTCELEPAIQGKVRKEDGSVELVNLPILLDCPVVFPRGGSCSLTFPVKEGDECLAIFASRGIDLWWQSGGVQPPYELRMHDLSDGFALMGPYSQVQVIPNVSTNAVQLRSDDGQAFFELNPNTHNFTLTTPANFTANVDTFTINASTVAINCDQFNVTASSKATITAPAIALNGQITGGGSGGATAVFTGSIEATNDVKAGNISLQGHVHTGDSGGTTTPPL